MLDRAKRGSQESPSSAGNGLGVSTPKHRIESLADNKKCIERSEMLDRAKRGSQESPSSGGNGLGVSTPKHRIESLADNKKNALSEAKCSTERSEGARNPLAPVATA